MKKYKNLFLVLTDDIIVTDVSNYPIDNISLKNDIMDSIKNMSPDNICILYNTSIFQSDLMPPLLTSVSSKQSYIKSILSNHCHINEHNISFVEYHAINNDVNDPMSMPNTGMLQFFHMFILDEKDTLLNGDDSYQSEGFITDMDNIRNKVYSVNMFRLNKDNTIFQDLMVGSKDNIYKETADRFGIDYMNADKFISKYIGYRFPNKEEMIYLLFLIWLTTLAISFVIVYVFIPFFTKMF